jgi:hypothetical protein
MPPTVIFNAVLMSILSAPLYGLLLLSL